MALISRMAAEFDVMFLSIPFRLFAGFMILTTTILLNEGVFRRVASDMLTALYRFVIG
jgi:flagellar biosynthesis protein FliR